MRSNQLILIFIFISSLTYGQTGEFQYFYHPNYFNTELVIEKKIKTITITSFWTRPGERIYQDKLNKYNYNQKSELICSETYYFKQYHPEIITQQTIDCYEYDDNGFQTKHLRYHDKKDSAEWIENFTYQLNDSSQISKIIVKDLSNPSNSNETEKFYDSKQRLIKKVTDYGYLTEYIYDANNNLIERIWGPKDGRRNRNIYTYDETGNMIKYELKGTTFDNFDLVEESNLYDDAGRLIERESIDAEGRKSTVKFYYDGKALIRSEYFDSVGELQSTECKNYEDGLIKSIIRMKDTIVQSKEVFVYEYF